MTRDLDRRRNFVDRLKSVPVLAAGAASAMGLVAYLAKPLTVSVGDIDVTGPLVVFGPTIYQMALDGEATGGGGGSWPDNEPASMTLIMSTDGSDKYFGTGGSGTGWFFGTRWQDAQTSEDVSDAPSRYGTAIKKTGSIGDVAGFNGLAEYNWSSTVGTRRHLYVRYIYRFSANYQVCSTNEKPFGYVGGPGGDGADAYIGMQAGDSSLYIANEFTGGGFNNIDLGTDLTTGAYNTLELYYVAESSASGSDGSYTVWWNGTQVANASSQNWGSGTPGWTQIDMTNYWGGASCTKSVADTIVVSEIYVSGKN